MSNQAAGRSVATMNGNNRPIWRRGALAAVSVAIILTPLSASSRMKLGAEEARVRERPFAAVAPQHCLVAHRVGKIELAVANNGTFGREYHPGPSVDWFTGEEIPHSCQYPKNSNIAYLFGGAFWIGAIVGRDTLVSVGADGWQWAYEMYPDQEPFGEIVYRSIKDPEKPEYLDAVSEEDYVAVYTDTFTQGVPDDISGRPHTPLHIEVTQASYAWSYAYAEDFVLFDYQIKNIGEQNLEDVFMGIYVDCMVCFDCMSSNGFTDDHSGFLHTYPSRYGTCDYLDTVFIAWIADNDGDPDVIFGDGNRHPCPHVTATRIIRTPSDALDVSYNWWIGNGNPALDFGPREKSGMGRRKEPVRDFGTGGLGTPEGDCNKYYVMSNREFDYNQTYAAVIQPTDSLWMYPNQELAFDFADGFDTRYLLSFGPFDIRPDQTLPISFAYVAGENIHTVEGNVDNLPGRPDRYLANLDFSDLALNATWASWVYDNPGVDTDHNGYAGKSRVCCSDSAVERIDTLGENPLVLDTVWRYTVCDTFFYEGDGVPDFRGASPPPAPEFRVETSVSAIRVRFNGLRSETTRDVFSRELDFEGYRVYLARDERASSYGVVASYDREDYNKYVWNENKRPYPDFELLEPPFTLEELRCLYGESCDDMSFHPLDYPRNSTYRHPLYPDSEFYFAPQDFNVSRPGVNTPIRKIYPDQPFPSSLSPDSAGPEEVTEDGRLKYFEYELELVNLLPTVAYWVNVTAFDYGAPKSGLASLETSVTEGAQVVYSGSGWEEVERDDLDVYVYPNPYRVDAGYGDWGFEGRAETDRPVDRTRAINFANLPLKCTIRILTLDGDLVREIKHDKQPGDGTATHEQWNLITRNTQIVVSGIYYFTVEDDRGRVQIGKLVIVM